VYPSAGRREVDHVLGGKVTSLLGLDLFVRGGAVSDDTEVEKRRRK